TTNRRRQPLRCHGRVTRLLVRRDVHISPALGGRSAESSIALHSPSLCAAERRAHNVIKLLGDCRATQGSPPAPSRRGKATSQQGALGLRGFKLNSRAWATKVAFAVQYDPGCPPEVVLPDFSAPWQLATSLTLAPRAEAIS